MIGPLRDVDGHGVSGTFTQIGITSARWTYASAPYVPY